MNKEKTEAEMLQEMKVVFAQMESEAISKRLKDGKKRKAEESNKKVLGGN